MSATFGQTRIFKKNFFKQYSKSFIGMFFVFLFLWMAFAAPEYRTATIITGVVSLLIAIIPFFEVGVVKVEPHKLTVETFFEQKEFTAPQIKEIKKQAIRGRYGHVTTLVNIIPLEGKNYPLGGFSDSDEVIYSMLMSWWNTNQRG